MATSTMFSDSLLKGVSRRFRGGDIEIRDFYRDKALQATRRDSSPYRLINTPEAKANEVKYPIPGKMLMYRYDPKHKDTLPYYDIFPLIFPISKVENNSFLGINMHYLPPVYRARLMDILYDNLNNTRYDESTKLMINYKVLNNASKFKYFRPCIKRYLMGHVRSRMIEIHPSEWEYVLFLPLATFQKASSRKVWDESIRKIQAA